MALKSDTLESCPDRKTGNRGCRTCQDYHECDGCGRRVCKWVSVNVADDDLICRPCARELGANENEIATQYFSTAFLLGKSEAGERDEAP